MSKYSPFDITGELAALASDLSDGERYIDASTVRKARDYIIELRDTVAQFDRELKKQIGKKINEPNK